MKATGDTYYANQQLMDYRLLSTMGFTKDDVEAIKKRPEVENVMAGYGMDLLMKHPEGAEVARVMSLPKDVSPQNPAYLNRLVVDEGRLPEAPNECFADSQSGYKLGDEVAVSPTNSSDSLGSMAEKRFTVVGLGASPAYISFQRGNATIGNGRVNYFLYVPSAAFNSDYYTEIFLTAKGSAGLSAFSEEYDSLIAGGGSALKAFGEERAQIRYAAIMDEGNAELADAQAEVADGRRELADAEQELADGKQELADAKAEAERELAKAWRQLQDGERELANGRIALADGERGLAEAQVTLQDGTRALAEGRAKLEAAQREYDAGFAEYSTKRAEYDMAKAQIDVLQPAVDGIPQMLTGLDAMTGGGVAEPPPEQLQGFAETAGALVQTASGTARLLSAGGQEAGVALAQQLQGIADAGGAALQSMQAGGSALAVYAALQPLLPLHPGMAAAVGGVQAQLNAALPELDAAAVTLAGAKAQLDAGWAEVAANQEKLNIGLAQLEEGKKQLKEARTKLADGEKELADGRRTYTEKKAEAEQKIADAEAEIADGMAEIADGKIELADAEKEIADGQKELDDLAAPTWYVNTREDSPGYSGFASDTGRIDAIAVVIPVFFFLVSALVCLTTMTRMVEEQRPLIGTLKGLGYSRSAIAFKFLLYAGIASTLGSVLGVLVGYLAFPTTIWKAYGMMYIMPAISLWNDLPLALSSVLFSVLCILAATWAACANELRSVPASLLRPKAPRAGKRVLLERMAPLWRRMSFMQKVAARNLFRYKKRFFMTVIGVAGCGALLVTGFGLRDSITGIVGLQYSGINQYDMMAVLTEPSTAAADTALNKALPQYGQGLYTTSVLVDAAAAGETSGDMTVYLYIAEDAAALDAFIDLHQRADGAKVSLPGSGGAVVTEKLANRLGLNAGDTFSVSRVNEAPVTLSVGGIAENYILNYIYITPDTYRALFGETPEYDTVLINLDEGLAATDDEVMAALLEAEPVAGAMDTLTLRAQFDDMFESLNAVVWLIIAAAALLAFVVLYNLTNINITERTREIATLKVLGFYNGEVASYIYRENLLLTLIGIAVGLVLGVFLHNFVIVTAEIDEVMFRRVIEPLSYVLSVLFTLACAGLVNLVMLRRLRSVDMVESLKSNE